jgi:hypothetical protein
MNKVITRDKKAIYLKRNPKLCKNKSYNVPCHGALPLPPQGHARARCAAANWVYHLPWVFLGLRAAAREDDGTTPTQAVFGSPLILPGQFLDSPELPSKDFLEQFSKTLSAAEHPSTKHNTAAARRRSCLTTCPSTDGVREVGRPRTAASTAL